MKIFEELFFFNFLCFSFIIFSCLFPTGFSATFSTLAFIFALPIFWKNFRDQEFPAFIIIGICLFAYLALSIAWSGENIVDSVISLFEYRISFMVPVFGVALSSMPNRIPFIIGASFLGCVIALLASYGLAFDILQVEGADNSLANRIYHGFIMSILLAGCLVGAGIVNFPYLRISLYFIAAIAFVNVLNIESGRTGYILIVSVVLLYSILRFKGRRLIFSWFSLLALVLISFFSVEKFQTQISNTYKNFYNSVLLDDVSGSNSISLRWEYYREGVSMGLDRPLLGYGIGGVVPELDRRYSSGLLTGPTDNLHSEFVGMFAAGGIPALIGFSLFILLICGLGIEIRRQKPALGDFFICLGVIIGISCLFNSSIKDYGEKHALFVCLTLGYCFWTSCRKAPIPLER